jgi:hypothetical protein
MGAMKELFNKLQEEQLTPQDVQYLKELEDYYHEHYVKSKQMFEKGKNYSRGQIILTCVENNVEVNDEGNHVTEHGADFLIGETFLTVKHNDDTYAFVLTGYSAETGGIYECIYAD